MIKTCVPAEVRYEKKVTRLVEKHHHHHQYQDCVYSEEEPRGLGGNHLSTERPVWFISALNLISYDFILLRSPLRRLDESGLPGRLLTVEALSEEQQRELNPKPPTSSQLRIGVARDWPDARAVWVSNNGSLVVWVNMEDHLRLVSTRDDANTTEAFSKHRLFLCACLRLEDSVWKQQPGRVTNSPASVGTGLRIRVHLRLRHVPKHKQLQDILDRLRINMEQTESPALYLACNTATFGVSEVGATQLVVDGVKLLILMESRRH
uniref:creatine kinase n=1 Tax=Mola mola TaxID=94237 RepID=A0A3Q3X859_MOLML